MRILFVGIVLLFLGVTKATEMPMGMVIVAKPPVYQAGESFTGTMWIVSGEKLKIHQKVEAGENKQLYLIKEFVNGNGVQIRSVVNLTMAEGSASMGDIQSRLVKSGCSREDFYPVILGKVYECEVVSVSTGNVTLHTKLRSEISSVQMDAEGRITGYCSLENEDHGVGASTTRVCYSADGKWIITAEILDSVSRIET